MRLQDVASGRLGSSTAREGRATEAVVTTDELKSLRLCVITASSLFDGRSGKDSPICKPSPAKSKYENRLLHTPRDPACLWKRFIRSFSAGFWGGSARRRNR